MKYVTLLLASSALLSACANLFTGTEQKILVTTPGVEGARCTLRDASYHRWHITPPETIHASKGGGALSIECEKEGYHPLSLTHQESLDALTLTNLAMGPFAIYGFYEDGFSGAAERYPDTLEIHLQPLGN